MKKLKVDIAISLSLVALTWFITIFLNGVMHEGRLLYVLESDASSDTTLIVQTVLWLMPKLLISYYLANTLFRNYKYTYAYYFVRSRDSLIWMKRVFVRISVSTGLFTFFKLSMAMVIEPSSAYILMSMIEMIYIILIAITIFIVLILTNSEKLSVLVMIVAITCNYIVFLSRNMEFISMIFLHQYPFVTISMYLLLCVIGLGVIYKILKKKEFYF